MPAAASPPHGPACRWGTASSRTSWEEIEPQTETCSCGEPRGGDGLVGAGRCRRRSQAALASPCDHR